MSAQLVARFIKQGLITMKPKPNLYKPSKTARQAKVRLLTQRYRAEKRGQPLDQFPKRIRRPKGSILYTAYDMKMAYDADNITSGTFEQWHQARYGKAPL